MAPPATLHISAPPLTLREFAPPQVDLRDIGTRLRRKLQLRKWVEGILFANGFYVTNAIAIVALDAIVDALDAGTAAVIELYAGTVPADADASGAGLTLLASLTMSATAFGAAADDTPGAIATAAAITSDTSADATGTATCFRVKTQTGGTVCMQGTVGTASADWLLNTVSITSGSTVACTAFTALLPEGP